MKDQENIRPITIVTIILVLITALILTIHPQNKNVVVVKEGENIILDKQSIVEEQKTINICYYRSNKANNNFYDTAWLKLNITGKKISGEFQNLPAEKDSKVGTFEGTIEQNNDTSSKHATVWWNSFAEGIKNKEELIINFDDSSATVGFGEMIDRGDGVYVYKDKNNLSYIDSLNQYDCESLNEKLLVEKYIQDNIQKIAIDKPVLGGSWYTTYVKVNPSIHAGTVMYEDGHIQSNADFIYTYEKNSQNIVITDFKVKK